MGDSPPLSDMPLFNSSLIEGIYQQFANFTLVLETLLSLSFFFFFFPFFNLFYSAVVKIKAQRRYNVFDLPQVKP